MICTNILTMGILKNTLAENTWNFRWMAKLQHGLLGSNREFDWLEIFQVFDKIINIQLSVIVTMLKSQLN